MHEDYTQDISCNPESFARITETYRRLRNTMRFLLGNLNDFLKDHTLYELPYKQLKDLDQWILHKLNHLIKEVTESYENYTFYKIYHLLNNFFNVEMSSLYLDIIKDRLYVSKSDSDERRSAQTALFHLTHTLVRLMAPILSFLSEEVYAFLPHKKDSVFLTSFPKFKPEWNRDDLEEKYTLLLAIRKKVSKTIEDFRSQKQIRSSLEAKVCLQSQAALFEFLTQIRDELMDFFIVSEVVLEQTGQTQKQANSVKRFALLEKQIESLEIMISKADGHKCVRCWHWSNQVGKVLPDLCPRCSRVVQ